MTATTHVTLWCDGTDCSVWTDHGDHSITRTRALARAEGWRTVRHVTDRVARLHDLCPFHVAHGASVAGRFAHGLALAPDDQPLNPKQDQPDGIPGKASLARLGERHGFTVVQ